MNVSRWLFKVSGKTILRHPNFRSPSRRIHTRRVNTFVKIFFLHEFFSRDFRNLDVSRLRHNYVHYSGHRSQYFQRDNIPKPPVVHHWSTLNLTLPLYSTPIHSIILTNAKYTSPSQLKYYSSTPNKSNKNPIGKSVRELIIQSRGRKFTEQLKASHYVMIFIGMGGGGGGGWVMEQKRGMIRFVDDLSTEVVRSIDFHSIHPIVLKF